MELIHPYYELLGLVPLDPADSAPFIEAAGRTCYKSEDKITPTSAQKFVGGIIKSGHHSVIEHSNLVMRLKNKSTFPVDVKERIVAAFGERMKYHKIHIHADYVYIAGNYRAWYQTIDALGMLDNIRSYEPHAARALCFDVYAIIKDMFSLSWTLEVEDAWRASSQFMAILDPAEVPRRLRQYSVRIVCDRGVTHEIVRHRPFAYSQESTRYVNYKGGMQFIIPNWVNIEPKGANEPLVQRFMDPPAYRWARACLDAELAYVKLIEEGWKPQQARSVLPNSLKTEIVCTAFKEDWEWLFKMRCSKAAHPQIRQIMEPLQEEMRKLGYVD